MEKIETGFVPGQPYPPYNPQQNISNESLEEVNNDAFYATGIEALESESPFEAEEILGRHESIIEEYNSMGSSAVVSMARQKAQSETDMASKEAIIGLIEDPEVNINEKNSILNAYTYGFTPPERLKNKYMNIITEAEAATSSDDDIVSLSLSVDKQKLIEEAINVGDSLKQNLINFKIDNPDASIDTQVSAQLLKSLATLQPGFSKFLEMTDDELEANDGFFYGLGLNAVQLFNALLVELPMYVSELGTVQLYGLGLTDEEKRKAELNMTEMRDKVRKLYQAEPEKVYGFFNDYEDVGLIGDVALNWRDFWQTVMKAGGLIATDEEFENFIAQESITLNTFQTIDDGFMYLAKKINEDNPEAAKVPLEIASFFVLWGLKRGGSLANRTKVRYDLNKAGYDKNVSRLIEELDKTDIKSNLDKTVFKNETNRFSWEETFAREQDAQGRPILVQNGVIDKVNGMSPRSPSTVTRTGNKEISNSLEIDIIEDGSGTLAKKSGVTRASIIALTFAPILGGILHKSRHVDLAEWSLQKKLMEQMGKDYYVNEGFAHPEKRKTWIRDTDNVLDDITAGMDIYQVNSESVFYTTDRGLNTSIVFAKNDRSSYKNLQEATDAVEVITTKIKEAGKSDFEVIIEHTDAAGGIKKQYKSVNEMLADPRFKKPIDSVANLEARKKQLLFEAAESRKILLNKKRVKAEAELQNVTPETWLRVAKENSKARQVEIKTIEENLQIAKAQEGKLTETPNIRVRVNRKSEWYDPAQQITDGFNAPPKRANWFTKNFFDMQKGFGLLAHFGSINSKLESTMHLAGLRSQAWMKRSLENLQKDINGLDTFQRNDVALLYQKSLDFKDYLTVDDITSMLGRPNLPIETAYMYQRIINKTRNINKFRFQAENVFQLNQMAKDGYTQSFKVAKIDAEGKPMLDSRGQPLIENIAAKDDFAWTVESNPKKVFDFSKNMGVDNPVAAVNMGGKNADGTITRRLHDANGVTKQKVYRLHKTYDDGNGNLYNYAVFGDQLPAQLPQQVIRSRTGHMPAIMQGSHFVRMYPKELTIDGITRTYDKHIKDGGTYESWITSMEAYSRAVMVAPTRLAAERWQKNSLDAWANESGINTSSHLFEIDIASEFKNKDRIEANTIREDAMRASKQRTDLPVAKALYEDAFAAFVVTTESNGARAYMQPLLAEYKSRWMQEYRNKIQPLKDTDGVLLDFPKNPESIVMRKGFEDSLNTAIKEYNQILVLDQGYAPNFIGRVLQKGAEIIAKTVDGSRKIPLVEKAMQKAAVVSYAVAKKPSLVQQTPMRATSILKIQYQVPMWHWLIQTANSFGHLAVGGYAGFNVNTLKGYKKSFGQASRIVFEMTMMKKDTVKYQNHLKAGLDWLEKNDSKMLGKTEIADLSAADRALIIQNGMKSGFFMVADHTFAKNFFRQGPKQLQASKLTRIFGKTNEKIGQVGFEQGELMGRVNTWMSVRLMWERQNPGKNWRSAKALEEINDGARKLAGSMDQYGEMMVQRIPILATFAQFSSFMFKSAEGIWNPSATPFNTAQRAAFAGWNFSVYGVRGGMIYGTFNLVSMALEAVFGEDTAAEIIREMDDVALLNVALNLFGDTIAPTYDEQGNLIRSDLEFNLRFSPMGADMPFGGYGALYKAFFSDKGIGNEAFGPSGQLIKDIIGKDGIANMLSAIYSDPIDDVTQTEQQVLGSMKAIAKLTGLSSGISRAILMYSLGDKRSKLGQYTGQQMTNAEKYIWGWTSVPSEAERLAFENFDTAKDFKQKHVDLAEGLYKALVLTVGDDITPDKLAEVQRGLKYALSGSDYLDEEGYNIVINHMTMINDRNSKTLFENIYTKAVEYGTSPDRIHPKRMKMLEKYDIMLENQGSNVQSDSVRYILDSLKASNARTSQEESLRQRKEAHEKGELY